MMMKNSLDTRLMMLRMMTITVMIMVIMMMRMLTLIPRVFDDEDEGAGVFNAEGDDAEVDDSEDEDAEDVRG